MQVTVLYDSQFGNTKQVAHAIAEALLTTHTVKTVQASDVSTLDLHDVDVLVVGSPTQGGRATAQLQKLLDDLAVGALSGIMCAVFDTRFAENKHGLALKLLMKTIGYAAPKIAQALKEKGGKFISQPQGFIVQGKEGPLAEGELERAKTWAKQLLA